VDIHVFCSNEGTSLYHSADSSNPIAVKLLLEHKANLLYKDMSETYDMSLLDLTDFTAEIKKMIRDYHESQVSSSDSSNVSFIENNEKCEVTFSKKFTKIMLKFPDGKIFTIC
jgi:hypothetical protein